MNVALLTNRVCGYNQVKMRSYWIRVGLRPMSGVLIRRATFGQKDTQREDEDRD